MPQFTYIARDRYGNPTQGFMIGADLETVREQLRERDLFMTSATVIGQEASEAAARARRYFKRVRFDDIVVMSRQLATLVRAGLPINEALHIVSQQSESPYLRTVLLEVRRDILGGSNFAEAVMRHPNVFSELYVALIRAGEAGGVLDETLENAAEQYDKEAELREKIKAAFTYPIIVICTAMFVIGFLVTAVIPQFAQFYAAFGKELPWMTLMLLSVSKAVTVFWVDLLVFIGLVAGVIGLRWYIRTEKGRQRWDRLKLVIWLFGKLNRKIAIARFTRALSAMVQAGVPILQALTVSARVSNNVIIYDAVMRVAEFVQQGARLWMPMEQTGEFPTLVTRMIAAGEESGNLDEMLRELTRYYNRDIEYTVQKLTRMMEPLLTIVIGVIVLFVLLALYMPIFNLTNVLKPR